MIELHRLSHSPEPLLVNPDLIATVEAHPDTVLTLTTGARMLVSESPSQIADAVRSWRASILREGVGAEGRRAIRRSSGAAMVVIAGTGGVARSEDSGARADHPGRSTS